MSQAATIERATTQTERADAFHRLHQGPGVLVLPNAWDVASAVTVAEAGAKAIATSSAAVAWTHGVADGDRLAIDATCALAAGITAAVDLPLTVDFEGGFTDDLDQLADNIARLVAAGAVGINFEDGARDPQLHATKIACARQAAEKAGVRLFINARTDIYLKGLAQGDAAEAEAIARARLYVQAGADGIFVPGAAEPALIGRLASAIARPLNILAWPGAPDAATLASLGARRLSAGTGTFNAAYAALSRAAAAFLAEGSSDAMMAAAKGAPSLQKRFLNG